MSGENTLNSKEQFKLWNDFLTRWPVKTIRGLTLEQYTSIGDKDSFCYWLEQKTDGLGTIGGNFSYMFGIYHRKPEKSKPDENHPRYAGDETYSWVKKYGRSRDEVFQRVRESILKIIEHVQSRSLDKIVELDTPLSHLVKWKIAFLYQPQDPPTLLPIYKADMLMKLAEMPDDTPVSQLQETLMSQKPADMDLLEYYDDLLQTRTDVFGKDTTDNQPSPSGESGGIEKPEDKNGKDSGDGKNEIGLSQEPKDENGHPLPRNLIYFGAPGTGKSYKLNEDVEKFFANRYERVTFYPTYSYAQFVGCYKPVMKAKSDGTSGEEIAYEFVPGPFLRLLVDALKAPKNNYCLVIEEINRANAAAVFGDVFQLLDRGGKWNTGDESIRSFFEDDAASEYDVAASEDIKRYLREKLDGNDAAITFLKVKKDGKGDWKECRLRIPSNMYIWATMNSADQGVFPLDTAFKRRWEFMYFGIDEGENDCADWTIEGANYNWNDVRKIANGLLSLNGVNEDKLMGAHFVSAMAKKVSNEAFESKVLMYLWEDAARMCRRQMFGDIMTYSELLNQWEKDGIKVFQKDNAFAKLSADLRNMYNRMVKPESDSNEPESNSADPAA